MTSSTKAGTRLACLRLLAVPVVLLFLFPPLARPAPSPGIVLVSLDARDPTAGSSVWKNEGTLGPFERVGNPQVRLIGGVPSIYLNGKTDAYRGPLSTARIEGRHPRTIEVWVYKPSVRYQEETLVAWGRRGGPAGSNMALNYGTDPSYGAVTHWAEDLGWNGVPAAGQWHYLVYTYDGSIARVYDNTAVKNSMRVRLDTAADHSINIGVQNSPRGDLAFVNEYNREPMSGPVYIASVRVEDAALSPQEIRPRFNAEAARFHAKPLESSYDLLISRGVQRLSSGGIVITLSKATQEALSLSPLGSDFDFLPFDRLEQRAHDGAYELGDVEFRTQQAGIEWHSFSTAAHHAALKPLKVAGVLAAADLSPSLDPSCPLDVQRRWIAAKGGVELQFLLRNRTARSVVLGTFGTPMVHNNILTGRSLEEAHTHCVFADPYVGGEAGYLQVTRLNGAGPTLLVLPDKGTSFEAYRPLHDDPTPRSVTFEGFYEWTVHSLAYAAQEWKGAEEWNRPTSRLIGPGESVSYGFRFVLAPGVREIEPTLIAHRRPVVVGIPGYVLPTDQPGRLFIHYPSAVAGIRVEPQSALTAAADHRHYRGGWRDLLLRGMKPGRCRITLKYADGTSQFVQYFVTLPAADLIRRFGEFNARRQWFADPKDPFGRTFSFLPYNDWSRQMVKQYDPTWMVGLSDEMGAGPNLAMAMKNLGQPDARQVAMLEKYANNALWGHLQLPDYGIRASLFYYDPSAFPGYYTVRGGWDKARSETTWRSFNYPHQAAIYWCLYRIARDHPGMARDRPWGWYLRQAYRTAMAMGTHAGPPPGGLQQFGQMVGDVYLKILRDLRREGWTTDAAALEGYEKIRADHFRSLQYPFGSEMPWDSTGQEEVYSLCRYFGYDDKARVTVDAVLAYDPTVPNWGYNGAGRRYFDEAVNGTEWPDIMRLLHHYGGAMNAIPLLADYRLHPQDLHLLRVGYGGTMGALTDIDAEGFGSQCFDADPAIMKFDPYVGDYGIEFYGFAANTGAYAAHDPVFGWLGFGCKVTPSARRVKIEPRDAFRNRLFIAPLGLYLTLDAGTFEGAVVDDARRRFTITLSPQTPDTTTALLRIEQTGRGQGSFRPAAPYRLMRGAYAIPLKTHCNRVFVIRISHL